MLTCNILNERYKQYKNCLYGKDIDNELLNKLMIDYFNNNECTDYTSCETKIVCQDVTIICNINIGQTFTSNCSSTITITQL